MQTDKDILRFRENYGPADFPSSLVMSPKWNPVS